MIFMKYKFASGLQVFFEMILGVVGVALLLGGSLYALQTFSTSLHVGGVSTGATTVASNATDSTITALATVPTWITIIIPVIGVVAVIGYFALVRPGGGKRGR